jgi:O-methyltransferase
VTGTERGEHMRTLGDAATQDLREAYLGLLKRTLTRSAFPETPYQPISATSSKAKSRLNHLIQSMLRPRGLELVHRASTDPARRERGGDWPLEAETMIGLKRLDNLEHCIVRVLRDGVPGDLVETGVWRGGATIFMRGVLMAYGVSDRTVWAADSFEGLPRPDAGRYPADKGNILYAVQYLAVSLEQVKINFRRYGLLDDQVRFLKGWFRDTLPNAPIDNIAVLRLDGDLYESTMDGLQYLYPKLSSGGYVIVDDYYSNETCRLAVTDYRELNGIKDTMIDIDEDAVFWQQKQ